MSASSQTSPKPAACWEISMIGLKMGNFNDWVENVVGGKYLTHPIRYLWEEKQDRRSSTENAHEFDIGPAYS